MSLPTFLGSGEGGTLDGTPVYVPRGMLGIILCRQKKYLWIHHRYHTFTSKASLNPAAKKIGVLEAQQTK